MGGSEEVMNARLAKPADIYSKYEVKVRLLEPKEYCYFLFQRYQKVTQMFHFYDMPVFGCMNKRPVLPLGTSGIDGKKIYGI